ncbi:MAG: 50S ribosomal protein L25/general stress protein Ctc [Bowdeniella nasicola]|nr:50S ribosomal protein L25/general stress protein Ctc [Bowdeniella nasicola]
MIEKLAAETRTDFGKGAARRLRREGKVPAVLYGKGDEPQHLALPSHDIFLIIKDKINALISVEYDGGKALSLVADVQRHPVSRVIEHVDLMKVTRDQKVAVDVPVTVVGETQPGTIHYIELVTLAVTAPVIDIPEQIEISVEGLGDGDVVRVQNLTLPEDVETELDPEQPLVMVEIPRIDEADLVTPGSEEEAEEGTEGEAEQAAEGDSEE